MTFKHTFKIGDKVQILPGRKYDSANADYDYGFIVKEDDKENWVVQVACDGRKKENNWESVKYLNK